MCTVSGLDRLRLLHVLGPFLLLLLPSGFRRDPLPLSFIARNAFDLYIPFFQTLSFTSLRPSFQAYGLARLTDFFG